MGHPERDEPRQELGIRCDCRQPTVQPSLGANRGNGRRFPLQDGLAPKSAADFAFLLHGFHFLGREGTMAIILPHGVLFRGRAEERIRTKLLKDGNIDTVIGLPPNLFYSTGIPVCILVLKKNAKTHHVLFINASEYFEKGKRQNNLRPDDIAKIVDTYRERKEEERYARRVSMEEIEKNGYNLNISRYVSTSKDQETIDLQAVNDALIDIEKKAVQILPKCIISFLKNLACLLFQGKTPHPAPNPAKSSAGLCLLESGLEARMYPKRRHVGSTHVRCKKKKNNINKYGESGIQEIRLGLLGLLIALIAIVISLTTPEIRKHLRLENDKSATDDLAGKLTEKEIAYILIARGIQEGTLTSKRNR